MNSKTDQKNKKMEKNSEFDERVIEISRVSRVVKGGRRIRFRVLVVIGDHNGRVSYGIAKANEITTAVKKAVSQAKKRIITVPIINDTIPYTMTVEEGSTKIFLGPATQGTSIVAGGAVRIVAELSGVKNILSKIIGSQNKINTVKAVYKAFKLFDNEKVEKLRSQLQLQESVNIKASKISDKKSENK